MSRKLPKDLVSFYPWGDGTHVTGDLLFFMQSTYGFPHELTVEVCRESGIVCGERDMERFGELEREHKVKSEPPNAT